MEKISWRIPARSVAIFQLACFCILIPLSVIILEIWISGSGSPNFLPSYSEFQNQTDQIRSQTEFAFIIWTYVVIFGINIGIGVFMCVILIKATNPATEPKKAIRFCKIWLITHWMLFLMGLLSFGFKIYSTRGLDWSNVIYYVVHLLFIIIVHAYKKELGKSVFERQAQICNNLHQLGTI